VDYRSDYGWPTEDDSVPVGGLAETARKILVGALVLAIASLMLAAALQHR
jgi:hypothetical protein